MPSTPADRLGLLRSAVADDNPVVFLLDIDLRTLKPWTRRRCWPRCAGPGG
jgi:pyruvate/2-oxoglutarate/acetoin dehydrogenase E1 component